VLDAGRAARQETSLAKVFAAEAEHRVAARPIDRKSVV